MSGLETAIRNALERSDRTNAEIRARIYQSARQALENGLKKQQIEDPDVIAKQRHRLEAVIHAIETEERAALRGRSAAAPAAPVVGQGGAGERAAPSPAAADLSVSPRREPTADGQGRAGQGESDLGALRADREDSLASGRTVPAPQSTAAGDKAASAAPDVGAAEKRPRKRRRGRLLSFAMVVATLAAAAGAAVWWIQTNDLLKSPADTGVANPPATVESEDFDGAAGLQNLAAQEGFSGEWVEVFTPAEVAAIKPGARSTVEPLNDAGGERVRVTSAVGGKEGDLVFEIPADILTQLSGKSSTLALTVQAMPGKTAEFSVECDFSSLGACGRHRFTVHDERLDMLFKISFDRSLAPSGPGRLVLNSDVSGAGNSLDIFAIRVLPGQ
ncbi:MULTISPECIES: biotin transporter BioY [unclassified Sinorhizobium]|uniref:biotin transporter BioY n=1 Tax=unclassified Sinorhizobium TaxID=2613772 RepID=UPI0024C31CF5|nr:MULTISPECIES: biotin transporter BioY [unclassified Sinorhizobium]MDK1377791.1 biotin transporter BioY [Sinorhizobium sp. 6-70]MDK1480163.1 biotin transporter BioY [Sinorhizobium sp. 6-117]